MYIYITFFLSKYLRDKGSDKSRFLLESIDMDTLRRALREVQLQGIIVAELSAVITITHRAMIERVYEETGVRVDT